MIEQALTGVAAAISIADSSALSSVQEALTALASGGLPSGAKQALPANAGASLDTAIALLGAASPAHIAAVISAEPTAPSAPEPTDPVPSDPEPTDPVPTDPEPTDPVPTDPEPVNTAPTISGTPPASALQGEAYRFVPTAKDADGDVLSFRIANRPTWATFNAATGELKGMPGAADVGTHSNITISVSDGELTAQLKPFSITVQAIALGSATLSWSAPTQNSDGSALVNLSGYRVYWGKESRNYANSQHITSPGVTTYVIENLSSGTYYFAVTAMSGSGLESGYSNEASKTMP
jgi:hypothetical protein